MTCKTVLQFAAISTGPSTHIDHLAPVAFLMGMPLIVTDPEAFALAQKYYPQVDVRMQEMADLTLEAIAHFDAIFACGKFWTLELQPTIELLYKKKVRIVHCPHGNSDKGHSIPHTVHQDIAYVYGSHMRELLQSNGSLERMKKPIVCGNMRLDFYRQHQDFYDAIVAKEVLSQLDRKRKTILYAPTWGDAENPTSFFTALDQIILSLREHVNIIIKLHPFIEENHPAETYRLMGKWEGTPHVLFLPPFPLIYPLLAQCDAYIGDFSSISYDFLAFDRPLYFFKPKHSPTLPIHQCGIVLSEEENMGACIMRTLEMDTYAAARQALYHHTFTKQTGEELRRETLWEILTPGG